MSLADDLRRQAQHLATREPRRPSQANLAHPFARAEVLARLDELDTAIEGWQMVRLDRAARFFLMTLPLWDQIRR